MPTQMMIQTATTTASTVHNVTPPAGATAGQAVASSASAQQATPQQSRPSRDEIKAAAVEMTKFVQNVQRNLNFSVDDDSGVTVVKVIDGESEEVIRQIPSEEMLALARRLRELEGDDTSGLLVRSKA